MSPRNSTKTKAPKEPKASKAKKEKAPKAPKEKKAKKSKKSADFNAAPRTPVAPPRKVPADVYTLTLLLSFVFFFGAVVMLYLDLASYK